MLLDALVSEQVLNALRRVEYSVLVELIVRLLLQVLGISDHLLRGLISSDEVWCFFVSALSRWRSVSVEVRVLLLDDIGLLLWHQHSARLLLHLINSSVLVVQRALRLALHRSHLHSHQILLLLQALAEAIVEVVLASSVVGRRGGQDAASLTRLSRLVAVHLWLLGEICWLVGRVDVALRLQTWR